jgi:hypothetical protein
MFLDLLLIGLILLLGALVARILLGPEDRCGVAPLAFPLGAGLLTWFLFLLSWIGLPITFISVIGVYLSLMILVLILGFALRRPGFRQNKGTLKAGERGGTWKISLAILLAGLISLSAILALGRSYSTWDAIAIWSIKGYGIAREGTIFAGQHWGAHGLSYPLNIPLLVSVFRLLSGDVLPGSKLIFPLFYASLILGYFQFWCHFKIPRSIAGLGALLVATIPIVFEYGTIGYANLPFTTYLVLGCFMALEGVSDKDPRLQLVSGILFGLACWTRPEGIFILLILLVTFLIAFRISYPGQVRFVFWLLPILIIGGIWGVFLGQYGGNSQFFLGIQGSIQSVSQGKFPTDAIPKILRTLVRQAFTIEIWGFTFPAAIALIILNYKKLHPKRYPQIFTLILLTITIGVTIICIYALGSLTGNLDVLISTGLDRMFLPSGLIMAAWMILLVGLPRGTYISSPNNTDHERIQSRYR